MEKKEKEYTNLDQERIVTVSDLLKEVVRRWKLVVICAVVFLVLCAGYKYAKDLKAAKAANADSGKTTTADTNLTDEEMTEVNNVISVQDNMQEQQKYLDNSVLMQINAYDESKVTLEYRIVSADKQLNKDLLSAYENYVNNGGLVQDMAAQGADLDLQYLNELISFAKDTDKDSSDDGTNTIITDTQSKTFDVVVIHKNQKSCEKLAALIPACMEQFGQTLNASTGEHGLTMVEQSYAEVVDRDLWTYKIDRVNSVVSMQERVDTLKEKLTADQVSLVEKSLKDSNAKKTDAKTEKVTAHLSKKYAVLGFGIGIILAILYIIISYILRGTINNAKDVSYLYNLKVMGTLKNQKNGASKAGDKLHGRRTVDFSAGESILSADLAGYCSKNQIQKLLIVTSDEIRDQKWTEKLVAALKQNGVEAAVEKDLLYDAQARERALSYDAAVLVAQVRQTRYETMEQEIAFCELQQIAIAGAVVVE